MIANTLEINDLLKEGVTGKIMLHGVLDEIYKHITKGPVFRGDKAGTVLMIQPVEKPS